MTDLTTTGGSSSGNAVAQTQTIAEKIAALQQERKTLRDPTEFLNSLSNPEVAMRYLHIAGKIMADSQEDPWSPIFLEISSDKKKDDKADVAKEHGTGVLFESSTGRVFKDGLRVFPLLLTRDNSLFAAGGLACKSIDGVRGETIRDIDSARENRELQKLNLPFRYTDAQRGTVHDCGSGTCPNPGYYQKMGDPNTFTKKPELYKSIPQKSCQASYALYVANADFTDVFLIPVKHFSIDSTVKLLSKELKNVAFNVDFDALLPTSTWWKLGTKEDGRGENTAWYFKTTKLDDQRLNTDEQRILTQLQLLVGQWQENRKHRRETKDVNNVDPAHAVDVEAVEATVTTPKKDVSGPSFANV